MYETSTLVAFHKLGDVRSAPLDWLQAFEGVTELEVRASGALRIVVIKECEDALVTTLRNRGWSVTPSRKYHI